MKINKIYLVVHPFFREALMQEIDFEGNSINSLPKISKLIIKNELDNYGRMINESVKNKESALVLFVPSIAFEDTFVGKNQSRLIKYFKKKLKGRLVILAPQFGFKNLRQLYRMDKFDRIPFLDFERKIRKFEFDPSVSIVATGQYRDKCVEDSAINTCELLSKRGVLARYKREAWAKSVHDVGEIYRRRETQKNSQFKAFAKWKRKVFGKRVVKN